MRLKSLSSSGQRTPVAVIGCFTCKSNSNGSSCSSTLHLCDHPHYWTVLNISQCPTYSRRKIFYMHRRHKFMSRWAFSRMRLAEKTKQYYRFNRNLTCRMEKRINKFRGWLPRKPMKFDDTLPDLEENESFTAPFSRSRIHQWVFTECPLQTHSPKKWTLSCTFAPF